MKNKTTKTIACVIAGLTLTACSSGSGITGIDSNENAMPSITDRVATQYRRGTYESLPSGQAANDTTIETQDTFNLRRSGDENLIATLNGRNYTIYPAGRDSNLIAWGGETGFLYFGVLDSMTDSNDIRQVIDGNHETVQGTFLRYNVIADDLDSESGFAYGARSGYAIVGRQTPASIVQQQVAMATYVGQISIMMEQDGATGIIPVTEIIASNERLSLAGNLTMNVNFNDMEIAGTAEFQRNDEDENVISRGMATFNSTPIIGNGFDGTFTFDNDLRTSTGLTENLTGNYGGNFFGPNADDLAGVIQMNGTDANGDVIGIGGFRADRN